MKEISAKDQIDQIQRQQLVLEEKRKREMLMVEEDRERLPIDIESITDFHAPPYKACRGLGKAHYESELQRLRNTELEAQEEVKRAALEGAEKAGWTQILEEGYASLNEVVGKQWQEIQKQAKQIQQMRNLAEAGEGSSRQEAQKAPEDNAAGKPVSIISASSAPSDSNMPPAPKTSMVERLLEACRAGKGADQQVKQLLESEAFKNAEDMLEVQRQCFVQCKDAVLSLEGEDKTRAALDVLLRQATVQLDPIVLGTLLLNEARRVEPDVGRVKLLLEKGASTTICSEEGAESEGPYPLDVAIEQRKYKLMQTLLTPCGLHQDIHTQCKNPAMKLQSALARAFSKWDAAAIKIFAQSGVPLDDCTQGVLTRKRDDVLIENWRCVQAWIENIPGSSAEQSSSSSNLFTFYMHLLQGPARPAECSLPTNAVSVDQQIESLLRCVNKLTAKEQSQFYSAFIWDYLPQNQQYEKLCVKKMISKIPIEYLNLHCERLLLEAIATGTEAGTKENQKKIQALIPGLLQRYGASPWFPHENFNLFQKWVNMQSGPQLSQIFFGRFLSYLLRKEKMEAGEICFLLEAKTMDRFSLTDKERIGYYQMVLHIILPIIFAEQEDAQEDRIPMSQDIGERIIWQSSKLQDVIAILRHIAKTALAPQLCLPEITVTNILLGTSSQDVALWQALNREKFDRGVCGDILRLLSRFQWGVPESPRYKALQQLRDIPSGPNESDIVEQYMAFLKLDQLMCGLKYQQLGCEEPDQGSMESNQQESIECLRGLCYQYFASCARAGASKFSMETVRDACEMFSAFNTILAKVADIPKRPGAPSSDTSPDLAASIAKNEIQKAVRAALSPFGLSCRSYQHTKLRPLALCEYEGFILSIIKNLSNNLHACREAVRNYKGSKPGESVVSNFTTLFKGSDGIRMSSCITAAHKELQEIPLYRKAAEQLKHEKQRGISIV